MNLVSYIIFYSVSNTILWSIILLILHGRRGKLFENHPRYVTKNHVDVRRSILVFLSLSVILAWLLLMHLRIGFLPFGQDTVDYTHAWHILNFKGHWLAEMSSEPYYKLFHVSAVTTYIVGLLLGFERAGYVVYLIALLLTVILSILLISRKLLLKHVSKVNIGMLSIITILLFLATPFLMGSDALQQYVSIVIALVCLTIIMVSPSNSMSIILYTMTATASVITHLSSVILLVLIILSLAISRRLGRRDALTALMTTFSIAISYVVYTYAAYSVIPGVSNVLKSFYNYISSLVHGTEARGISIVAYSELSNSRIWVYSWTLLPSLGLAYIVTYFINGIRRLKGLGIIETLKLMKKDLIALTYLLSGIIMLGGELTRLTGYNISRYTAVPSYYAMFLASIMLLYKYFYKITTLGIRAKRIILTMVLCLFLLGMGLYSGIQDPHRMPWNGEPRLAPVTYRDRVELMPIAIYAPSCMRIYPWHDAYVPMELTNSTIISRGSYYPIHQLLLKVARGLPINLARDDKAVTTLFVIPNQLLSSKSCERYDVVFMGGEHTALGAP